MDLAIFWAVGSFVTLNCVALSIVKGPHAVTWIFYCLSGYRWMRTEVSNRVGGYKLLTLSRHQSSLSFFGRYGVAGICNTAGAIFALVSTISYACEYPKGRYRGWLLGQQFFNLGMAKITNANTSCFPCSDKFFHCPPCWSNWYINCERVPVLILWRKRVRRLLAPWIRPVNLLPRMSDLRLCSRELCFLALTR